MPVRRVGPAPPSSPRLFPGGLSRIHPPRRPGRARGAVATCLSSDRPSSLGASAESTVLYTAFDGNLWAWGLLANVGNDAGYLSGFAPESGAKPAVIWTQPAGGSYGIGGALLPYRRARTWPSS